MLFCFFYINLVNFYSYFICFLERVLYLGSIFMCKRLREKREVGMLEREKYCFIVIMKDKIIV